MDARSVRVALYARVSTEEQAVEGFSLDAQMKRLRKYCNSQGWTVAGEYREEGHSGRDVKRPEYTRMMEESDKWDVVLVLKMDRIHRNSENFTRMMKDLNSSGKGFCSVMEQFDTNNAMGRFVMDLIQRIAQLESEQIGERVKLGMEQKARTKGGLLGFGQPYGYDYKGGTLLVNDDEVFVVRAIYKLYNKGFAMDKIASSLNDADIPAKKGGRWNKQSIAKILHNPLYVGYTKWGEIVREGEHPAIIDMDDFVSINGPVRVNT